MTDPLLLVLLILLVLVLLGGFVPTVGNYSRSLFGLIITLLLIVVLLRFLGVV